MKEKTQHILIGLCKEGSKHQHDIHIDDGNWKIYDFEIQGFKGFVLVRQDEEKPDWLELVSAFSEINPDEIRDKIVRGLWILEIENRIVVASFEGAERYLNVFHFEGNLTPHEIEFGNSKTDFHNNILAAMKATRSKVLIP